MSCAEMLCYSFIAAYVELVAVLEPEDVNKLPPSLDAAATPEYGDIVPPLVPPIPVNFITDQVEVVPEPDSTAISNLVHNEDDPLITEVVSLVQLSSQN